MEKYKIGWFSFTCCEDSTIIFSELLNDYWDIWKDKIEIVNARVLRTKSKISNLDIAFVEGAISSESQKEKLLKIRKESKILIAVGSCAISAMPAGVRNTFDEKTKNEIDFILKRFSHLDKIEPISKFVKVDDQIPGCPMKEKDFLEVLNKYAQN